MEPRFQSSFIPKKPIVSATQGMSFPTERSTDIFTLVASVLFTVAVLVSGGFFFYKTYLNKQILSADTAVNQARSAFQLDKVQELIDVNARMRAINGLLDRHVAVSKLIAFMQQSTLKKIRFDEFVYKNKEDGLPVLSMKAEAQSYNALATQGDVFAKSDFIQNPYFSEFTPQDNGYIRANFSSTIDSSLVSYKRAIESITQ